MGKDCQWRSSREDLEENRIQKLVLKKENMKNRTFKLENVIVLSIALVMLVTVVTMVATH